MRRAAWVMLLSALTGSAVRAQAVSTAPPSPAPLAPAPAPIPAKGVPAPPPPISAPEAPPKSLAGTSAPAERVRPFNPAAVRLSWANRRWQLVADGVVLKDFGYREGEARQALRVIHDFHLNQLGTVGSPAPVMEYWLSDGRAPQSLVGGLRVLPLEPAGLRVEQVQGQWCLRDSQRVLFNFAQRPEEAREALAVIRKYGFTQIGVVGQGTPSMFVFTTRAGVPEGAGAPPASPPTLTGAGRHLNVAPFPRHQAEPKVSPNPASPVAPTGPVTPALPTLAAGQAAALEVHRAHSAAGEPNGGWRGQPHSGPRPLRGAVPTPQRVPFDWRQVQLRQENADWKMKAGNLVLANFGSNDHDARLALSALRHYRFTEQWRVGGESAPFTYYLANGQAPRGLLLGLPGQAFQPKDVTVQQIGSRYALVGDGQVLARLGERPEEARQVLEVIKRNRFDRLVRLGQDGQEGMTFLVRSR